MLMSIEDCRAKERSTRRNDNEIHRNRDRYNSNKRWAIIVAAIGITIVNLKELTEVGETAPKKEGEISRPDEIH